MLSSLSQVFRKPFANVHISRKVRFAHVWQIYACGPQSCKTFHGFLYGPHMRSTRSSPVICKRQWLPQSDIRNEPGRFFCEGAKQVNKAGIGISQLGPARFFNHSSDFWSAFERSTVMICTWSWELFWHFPGTSENLRLCGAPLRWRLWRPRMVWVGPWWHWFRPRILLSSHVEVLWFYDVPCRHSWILWRQLLKTLVSRKFFTIQLWKEV